MIDESTVVAETPAPVVPRRKYRKSYRGTESEEIGTQTAVAMRISSHFNIPCSAQLIQDWQRRWTPPFPRPRGNHNRYYWVDCEKWVREEYLPKHTANGADQTSLIVRAEKAKQELMIHKAAREKHELEVQQGKYIERAIAERTIVSVLRNYHALVRRTLEVNLPHRRKEKLSELGVNAETLASFHQYDLRSSQAIIDQVETAWEEHLNTAHFNAVNP